MKKRKYPSTSNRRNNIIKQCHILVLVLFATSKAIPDISYSKLCIPIASLFAERRKITILGHKEILAKSQILLGKNLVPSVLSTNKTLFVAAKNYAEKHVEVSWSCRI